MSDESAKIVNFHLDNFKLSSTPTTTLDALMLMQTSERDGNRLEN